jgi:hypothetical protein
MRLRLARGLVFVTVIALVAVIALQHAEEALRVTLDRRAAADTAPGRPR